MPSSGRITRDPIQQYRLGLRNSKLLDFDSLSHVLLWIQDIEARTSDDPHQRAIVRSALVAYTRLTHIGNELLTLPSGSARSEKLTAQYSRLTELLAKSLRLAGLRRSGSEGKGHTKQATIFTPTRLPDPPDVTEIVTYADDNVTTTPLAASSLE